MPCPEGERHSNLAHCIALHYAVLCCAVLQVWFARHWANPYPDAASKEYLVSVCGLSPQQLVDWLRNERRRYNPSASSGVALPPASAVPVPAPASAPAGAAVALLGGGGGKAATATATLHVAVVGADGRIPLLGAQTVTAAALAGAGAPSAGTGRRSSTRGPAATSSSSSSSKDKAAATSGGRPGLGSIMLTRQDGVPLALPEGSLVTSDGYVLVPESALPVCRFAVVLPLSCLTRDILQEGAIALAPAVAIPDGLLPPPGSSAHIVVKGHGSGSAWDGRGRSVAGSAATMAASTRKRRRGSSSDSKDKELAEEADDDVTSSVADANAAAAAAMAEEDDLVLDGPLQLTQVS